MSVDKDKFENFDFGELGKSVTTKNEIIVEGNEFEEAKDTDSKEIENVDNPFGDDDDDINGDDDNEDVDDIEDDNPFAIDTGIGSNVAPKNQPETGNVNNNAFEQNDPFKDLFG